MKKHHAILCLTALLALLTAVLILRTSIRDKQAFGDNVTCFYESGSMQEIPREKACEYLYALLYSDDISLPAVDGSVHWTRDGDLAGHAYAICFFQTPFSLEVTDPFGGSQSIEAVTAVLMDFDQQVVYFSHQPASPGTKAIAFSQGNAVADEEGQALLVKLAQELQIPQN